MRIERVTPVGRPPGILHCPNCGRRLGRTDDPATGYLTRCSLCQAELVMRIEGPAIMATVRDP